MQTVCESFEDLHLLSVGHLPEDWIVPKRDYKNKKRTHVRFKSLQIFFLEQKHH